MKTASMAPCNRVHVVHKCWFDFWFVFDAGSASKTKPKYTNLWYGFGMVLVWYGMV